MWVYFLLVLFLAITKMHIFNIDYKLSSSYFSHIFSSLFIQFCLLSGFLHHKHQEPMGSSSKTSHWCYCLLFNSIIPSITTDFSLFDIETVLMLFLAFISSALWVLWPLMHLRFAKIFLEVEHRIKSQEHF